MNITKEETLTSLEAFVDTNLIPVIADNAKTEVGSAVVNLSGELKGFMAQELLKVEIRVLEGTLDELFTKPETALTWEDQKDLLVSRIETLVGSNGSEIGNAAVADNVTVDEPVAETPTAV